MGDDIRFCLFDFLFEGEEEENDSSKIGSGGVSDPRPFRLRDTGDASENEGDDIDSSSEGEYSDDDDSEGDDGDKGEKGSPVNSTESSKIGSVLGGDGLGMTGRAVTVLVLVLLLLSSAGGSVDEGTTFLLSSPPPSPPSPPPPLSSPSPG